MLKVEDRHRWRQAGVLRTLIRYAKNIYTHANRHPACIFVDRLRFGLEDVATAWSGVAALPDCGQRAVHGHRIWTTRNGRQWIWRRNSGKLFEFTVSFFKQL